MTRGVLDRIRRGKHLQGDRRLALLSAQEERVLTEASAGKTNRQIAESLQVSRRAEAATYLVRHTSLSG